MYNSFKFQRKKFRLKDPKPTNIIYKLQYEAKVVLR